MLYNNKYIKYYIIIIIIITLVILTLNYKVLTN
jgi:hypothetical protein